MIACLHRLLKNDASPPERDAAFPQPRVDNDRTACGWPRSLSSAARASGISRPRALVRSHLTHSRYYLGGLISTHGTVLVNTFHSGYYYTSIL
jgi:hypothetical protein